MARPSVGDEVTADLLDQLTYKPVTQLEQQASDTLPHATAVDSTFGVGSEVFDDETWHDTSANTTRVTPTIAGRYRVQARGVITANNTVTSVQTYIKKNGSTICNSGNQKPAATNSIALAAPQLETFVDMNGTTDYISMGLQQSSTGSVSQTTNNASSGRTTLIVQLHSRT